MLFKRFLGNTKRSESEVSHSEPVEQLIQEAQNGDIRIRNELITDYQPYIAKITSRFCRRYIDPSRDDEFAIALDAFNEAINKYSPASGRSFLSFAETVIRRRLIDYVRKEQKYGQHIPYTSFEVEDEEQQVINPVEIHQAIQKHEANRDAEARREEIAEYTSVLARYEISFSELVDASPKHMDSRHMLFRVARTLAASESMMELFMDKGQLPIKQLLSAVDVSRKTVERNRKYIIAVALIFHGNYPYLQDYLFSGIEQSERRGHHA